MNKHARYCIRRTAQSAVILWIISVLAFTVTHLAPGGPISAFEDPSISSETVDQINQSLGLRDPIPIQYTRWLGRALRGDLGRSYIDSRPVTAIILERLPATIQLGLCARILGLLGIPLGILAALHHGRPIDNLFRITTAVGSSMPHWWIGMMMLVFVAAPTGLFPLGGMYTIGKQASMLDRLWHLALPVFIFALADWIVWSRYMRSQTLDALRQDYVRTAYSKGLKRSTVVYRHVFPNALIPAITILGDLFAIIISGSVLFETVFSWPGIGRLTFMAANQRDYPVVLALVMIVSSILIVGNLLADILYTWVDPRVELL